MKSVLRDASPLLASRSLMPIMASRSPIFKHDTCYQHKPNDNSDSWFYLGKIICIMFKNELKHEPEYTTLFYSHLFGDYEFTDYDDNKIDQFEVGICYKYNPKDSDLMPIVLGTVKIVIFEIEETSLPFPEILETEIVEECPCQIQRQIQIQRQRQRPGGKRSNRSKKRRRSNKRKSIRHK